MKNLIEKLGIADIPAPVNTLDIINLENANISDEKLYAMQNIKTAITNAMFCLPKITSTLEESPTPRMVEATSNFYKMIVDLNETYSKMSQDVIPEQNVTNNNIAIFTTEDLIDKVRQRLKV